VPANRLGYGQFSGFQLKIIQEVVTIVVFIVFAITFLKEKLAWNYLWRSPFWRRRVLCFCVQGARTGHLSDRAGLRESVHDADDLK